MNSEFVLIPILGLLSFGGAIAGLLYFEWYERHQSVWRYRVEAVRQAAIAETLARPKSPKIVRPHRLYTPPKPASPCDCPHCRLLRLQQDTQASLSISATTPMSPASATPPKSNPSDSTPTTATSEIIDTDVAALQRGLLPAYLWPFINHKDVIPYSQTKSNRGCKKQYSTAGFACPHLECDYCGITDESIHALIHYGHHGTREAIPDLKCQACGRKITSRMMTALFRLRTPSEKVSLILNSIAEGMSEEGATRTFNPSDERPHLQSNTLRRWIARAAKHSHALHAILFTGLRLPILQLDELRAILRAPNTLSSLTLATRSADQSITWVWTGMCPITKIMPVLQVGPRSQDMAHSVLHELALRLDPNIDAAPLFLTDGLLAYYYAITAHFGDGQATVVDASAPQMPAFFFKSKPDLLYVQIRKHRVRRKITHIETVAMIGFLPAIQRRLRAYGFTGTSNTSYVERLNGTMRGDVAALARKAQALARSPKHLLQLLSMWRAYYHFVRSHSSLRLPKSRQPNTRLRERTPAMAAGIVDTRWSFLRFLRTPTFPSLFATVNSIRLAC